MTESNRSMNEVAALVEERRRYEGWLTALEARRDSTPEHVFKRVHADYHSRLQRVDEQLASHRQGIEEERANVQSRLSLLEAEEQLRRDERAELDLRAHVGELKGSDAEAAFRTVDDAIQQLVEERDALRDRIVELSALLEAGAARSAAPAPAAHGAAPAQAPQPAAEQPPHSAEPLPAPAVEAQAESTGETQPEVAASAADASESKQELLTPGGTFDELAFLHEVVGEDGTPAHARPVAPESRVGAEAASSAAQSPREPSAAESILDGIVTRQRGGPGEPPLAANVPSNTPIVLRTSGTIEQSKTLKCTECGAMNYPTEWYCERCGAELAAL